MENGSGGMVVVRLIIIKVSFRLIQALDKLVLWATRYVIGWALIFAHLASCMILAGDSVRVGIRRHWLANSARFYSSASCWDLRFCLVMNISN
jgi:phage-related tail fiber protein